MQSTNSQTTTKNRRRQRGTSLVEVMVALLVLTIGLLGLALLQIKGMKFSTNAYFRTQSTLLANDIIERMRANRTGAALYASNVNPGEPMTKCEGVTTCNTTQLAAYDLWRWYEAQVDGANGLPDPTSSIVASTTIANQYTISIEWNERGTPMMQQWILQL